MADTKISALTALTGAGTADTDVLPIVDVDANATKKITVAELTEKIGIGGTAVDLTGLADGDGLVYDSGTTSFVAADVLPITPGSPTDGDVLTYDSGSGTYGPAPVTLGGGALHGLSRARSGAYYGPLSYNGTMSSSSGGLNSLIVVPIWLEAGTLDRIGVYHVGSATASEVMRLGLYGEDGSGYPGELIIDADTVDLSTATGFKTKTISQVITTGLYWLGAARQGPTATATVSALNAVNGNQSGSGASLHLPLNDPTGGIWNRIAAFSVAASGALPATPTWTSRMLNETSYPNWAVAVRYV